MLNSIRVLSLTAATVEALHSAKADRIAAKKEQRAALAKQKARECLQKLQASELYRSMGRTDLMQAVECEDLEIVEMMMGDLNGLDVNEQDKYGVTALHLAAQKPSETGILDLLLDNGASIDVYDSWGMTPLMWACKADAATLNPNQDIKRNIQELILRNRSTEWATGLTKYISQAEYDALPADRKKLYKFKRGVMRGKDYFLKQPDSAKMFATKYVGYDADINREFEITADKLKDYFWDEKTQRWSLTKEYRKWSDTHISGKYGH